MAIIRSETPDDIAAIHAVTRAAFKLPSLKRAAEADLVDALRARGDAVISLVAEHDGHIVGHVMLSKLQAPPRCLGLAPISVAPDHQNKGIGGKLITTAIDLARRDEWAAVFLLGNPAYYTRFGFRVDAAAKFETPYPKAYMMALALKPGALASLSGAITYAPPFSALD